MHDSDSTYGNTFVIDTWHRARGFLYQHRNSGTKIHTGYHYLMLNGYLYDGSQFDRPSDGQIIVCRPDNIIGAHCRDRGMNRKSLGVCMIGPQDRHGSKFSAKQLSGLLFLCNRLCTEHGIGTKNVLGHKEVSGRKSDPRIDMGFFRSLLRETIH